MTQGLPLRKDLLQIAEWIEPGSRVLDLGCGDGALLDHLQQTRQVTGVGVEINDERVLGCARRGVDVIQQNLEEGLALFSDKCFDTVVLSLTLQSVLQTEHILREMKRVAHHGVVSFPNFGYFTHGLSLLRGRMPMSSQMPYKWYNTPNIHLCTLKDFEDLSRQLELEVEARKTYNTEREVTWLAGWRATLALYRFRSEPGQA
ncbi:methionine biosynthesis protein MetW [Orrella sp. 11846]|uniref:methionine biosynthesis protein MetW n=1 Tax=Orrella sp. 11846 TaxID=3409913 RepID=UPI003B594EFD